MKRKVMLIDAALCHDCNNCFLACKDEHCGNSHHGKPPQPKHGHRWMDILRRERGSYPMIDMAFLPKPCMQCFEADCGDYTNRRADGIVIIDPEKAKGKSDIGCPYGSVYYNEEHGLPQKCDFCAHLLDEGAELPRCVEVCPTGALEFREVTEGEYEGLLAGGYGPYGGAVKPSVLYKNLARYEKEFIGGSVIKDGDCLEGVPVVLKKGGRKAGRQHTNGFGDFKFDGLDRGRYSVAITVDNLTRELEVLVDDSISLGAIRFE